MALVSVLLHPCWWCFVLFASMFVVSLLCGFQRIGSFVLFSWSWVTWWEFKGLLDAFVYLEPHSFYLEPSSINTHALLVLCVPCNTGGLLSVRG